MRDTTVRQFMQRYQVDARQAGRVEGTALRFLGQMVSPGEPRYENESRLLRWAAALHEIGISIARSGFHRHGAYIVGSADMPGFSRKDQERVSLLVLGQRGKLEKLPLIPPFDPLWRLIFCLRLAALLHRSRDDEPLPSLRVKQNSSGFQVELPAQWLKENPLTAGTLADESLVWQRVGWPWLLRRRTLPGGE
jgi:exopolyphosphatase/guanosine-5'-triphosphate,3'-diphosphate pyrophosphatase